MRRVLVALAIPALIAVVLAVDHFVGVTGQVVLAGVALAVLAGIFPRLQPHVRAQAVLVIVVSAFGEVLASLVWGLYTYRLENVPAFVPPGHALVYLGGLAVAAAFAGRERWLVAGAFVATAVWAVAGVTVLPRMDVAGAAAAVFFLVVLLRASRAHVYAGVFVVVAFLEIYGTAIGTWTWAEHVPGFGIGSGNPPSGAAAGYVLLEATAVRAAWRLRGVRNALEFVFRGRGTDRVDSERDAVRPGAEPGDALGVT